MYDPAASRWLSQDPIKDGLNWYEYCYSNPLKYVDPDGLKPYSVRNGMLWWQNGYTLHVTSQAMDTADLIESIISFATPLVVGAVGTPVAGAVTGGAFTAGEWAFAGISGWRDINYNSGAFDTIKGNVDTGLNVQSLTGLLNLLPKSKQLTKALSLLGKLDTLGNVLGGMSLAVDIVDHANRFYLSDQNKIEEAIYNSFSPDMWVSNTRKGVDAKFEYTMNEISRLISGNHIKLGTRNGQYYFVPLTGSGKDALKSNGIEAAVRRGYYTTSTPWYVGDRRAS